jgi:heat shock protein HslJ
MTGEIAFSGKHEEHGRQTRPSSVTKRLKRVAPIAGSLLSIMVTCAFANEGFRARGNEPGWSVTITKSAIEFRTIDGEMIAISPVPQPQRQGRTETYSGEANGQAFSLVVSDAVCVDSMSGLPYPNTVSISLGESRMNGCGGNPATLLQGDWSIVAVNGSDLSGPQLPTLSFDANGGLAGGGFCNRFFGSYELSGERLTIGGMGSTQMACEEALMKQEALLLGSLSKVDSFVVEPGKMLALKGQEAMIELRPKASQ